MHRVDSPGKESLSLLGEVEGLDALEREDGLGGDGRKRGEEHRDTHFFFSAVLLIMVCVLYLFKEFFKGESSSFWIHSCGLSNLHLMLSTAVKIFELVPTGGRAIMG